MSIHRSTSSSATSHGVNEETPLLNEALHSPSELHNEEPQSEEETVLPPPMSNTRLAITLGSVYVGVFLGALDSTLIATLSAPISTSFNSLSLLSWLASAYLIANAACQPLSGRLTDIFSRRTGLVVSNILFALGNLICGLATSQGSMIAGRVVAGMGGGGLMAISTFVGSDLVPLRQRGMIQGIGNLCFGSGAGLGGLFGGWVDSIWGWRAAFLIQVPLVIVSGILAWIFVRVPPKKSSKPKLSRVDFLGAGSLLLTLILLLLGLNSGGNIVPWTHPLVLVSLPLSLCSLLAFIYIEAFIASEPIIPVHLLLNRTVAAACLCNWFITMVQYMVIFYIPIFFQVKGLTVTASGLFLIPQSVGSSFGSLASGLIMNKTGTYKKLSLFVLGIHSLGTGLLCTLRMDGVEWPTYIYQFLIGTGYAGMLTVTLLAVISAVDHDHHSVVTSATYAFRATGSTIGVTIASAVYQNLLSSGLHERFDSFPNAGEEINRIRESLDELNHLPPGWKAGVMDSYEHALRGVFATALGIAVLGAVTGGFMRQHKLHSSLDRKDVEEEIEETVS